MPNNIENLPEILTNCRFYVELKLDGSQDPVDAYFMECKGFKRTFDMAEICEVAPQQWGKAKSGLVIRSKIPGNTKTNNITLKRGMTKSITLWNWFAAVEAGKWAEQIRNGSLTIYDQSGVEQGVFQFRGASPISYSFSDVNASGNDIEIEEMELAVETFVRTK